MLSKFFALNTVKFLNAKNQELKNVDLLMSWMLEIGVWKCGVSDFCYDLLLLFDHYVRISFITSC
jgi:hypothetical protein